MRNVITQFYNFDSIVHPHKIYQKNQIDKILFIKNIEFNKILQSYGD